MPLGAALRRSPFESSRKLLDNLVDQGGRALAAIASACRGIHGAPEDSAPASAAEARPLPHAWSRSAPRRALRPLRCSKTGAESVARDLAACHPGVPASVDRRAT